MRSVGMSYMLCWSTSPVISCWSCLHTILALIRNLYPINLFRSDHSYYRLSPQSLWLFIWANVHIFVRRSKLSLDILEHMCYNWDGFFIKETTRMSIKCSSVSIMSYLFTDWFFLVLSPLPYLKEGGIKGGWVSSYIMSPWKRRPPHTRVRCLRKELNGFEFYFFY